MRLAIRLLTILALVAIIQMSVARTSYSPNVSAATIQSEPAPKVLNVRRNGKRLLVSGDGFQMGAMIVVNGERQKTRNDEDNPTSLLIAKKAGKHLPADAVVSIQVENPAEVKSDPFDFFNGLTLTVKDAGKTFHLSVGQRFQLLIELDTYDVTTTVQDETILKKISDPPALPAALWTYEAQRRGQTRLFALANPKCSKLKPACAVPSLSYQFDLIVE
jgi:hypothetical protein